MPDPTVIPAAFTVEALRTIPGAALATFVVSTTIQKAFNLNPKWLALIIALAVTNGAAWYFKGEGPTNYLIASLNGCLAYLTAVGANTVLPNAQSSAPLGGRDGGKRKMLTRWF